MNRLFSILVFVSAFTTAQANTIEPIATEGTSVVVSFASWKGSAVTVDIIDESGSAVYTDVVKTLGGKKRYQLSLLPAGDYTIRTANDLRVEKQTVRISRGQVATISDVDVAYRPMISTKADLILVNYLTGNKPATVTIYDDAGNSIYRNTYDVASLNTSYDISTLPKGTYVISVSNGETSKTSTVTRS